jgi:hypothetical protein
VIVAVTVIVAEFVAMIVAEFVVVIVAESVMVGLHLYFRAVRMGQGKGVVAYF